MTENEDFQPTDLGDVLNGRPPLPEVEPEPEKEPEQGKEPAPEPEKAETGEQQPQKGEGEPPSPKQNSDDLEGKEAIPVAQARDERRKRQAAEQERDRLNQEKADLQRQLEQMRSGQNRQQQQEHPKRGDRPDQFEDPEGARRWDEEKADERDWNLRCQITRDTYVELKGEADYLEKETAFLAEVQRNPVLSIALRQSPNPAKFAYQEGAKLLMMQEVGNDPAAYRTKLRDDLKAEILAELKAEQEANLNGQKPPEQQKPAIPQTLAKVQSQTPRDPGKAWGGPTPLSEILK